MLFDNTAVIRSRILFLGQTAAIGLMVVLLVSCSQPVPARIDTPTIPGQLTPYLSATPSLTPIPPTPLVEIPITPAPTATPFMHEITKGETMLGIAIQYGIELDALLEANPTVNPRILSVGTELVIPLQGKDPEVIPTLTPVALPLGDPHCYPAADGGAWCVIRIENSYDFDLENISAWIGLYNASGNRFASGIAVPPLNRLPSGGKLPLMVFFPAPLPESYKPRGELLTSFAIREDDSRYLEASINLDAIKIEDDGKQAEVKGQVYFPANVNPLPGQVWVVLMALDANDQVVGMRKAEYSLSCGTPQESPASQTPSLTPSVQPCPPLTFELTIYSLGPKVNRVEGLVEARP